MITIETLIQAAASYDREPEYSEIFAFCEAKHIAPEAFCNEFSLQVAKGFHSGQLSYELCDNAMNYLFGFFTTPPMLGPDKSLPEPAMEIYLAFDAGEYYRRTDPPGTDPVEKYTRPQVAEILRAFP